MRYDNSRASLERHATYIVAAYLAGAASGLDRGTWHLMAGLPYVARLAFGFRVPRHRHARAVIGVGDVVSSRGEPPVRRAEGRDQPSG